MPAKRKAAVDVLETFAAGSADERTVRAQGASVVDIFGDASRQIPNVCLQKKNIVPSNTSVF